MRVCLLQVALETAGHLCRQGPVCLCACTRYASPLLLQVSLGGLWVMPAIIGTTLKFWRFLVVWAIYSIITGYLMSLCSHKKMARSTPRMVGLLCTGGRGGERAHMCDGRVA